MRQALRLLVFCVLATPLFAGTTLPTAPKPVTIIRQNDIVHVFTAKVDANYNDTLNTGDRPATWQIIDQSTLTTQRTLEFPWANVGSSRPWLAASIDRMYVGVGDSVVAYVATTQQYISATGGGMSYGLYYDDEAQEIYSSRRTSYTDPGVVHVTSLATQNEWDVPVGVNPQQLVGYRSTVNGRGVAIVNEGAFGQNDGSLILYGQDGQSTIVPLGDTPNHVLVSGDSAYVTVNGSHTIVVVDLNLERAIDTIPVGTNGYDGPREAAIKDGRLFVSTFAGDVRIFDIATGTRVGFIQHGPKAEGLAIVGNSLWVTRAMDANYGADSGVVMYDLNDVTSTPRDGVYQREPLQSPLIIAPSVASNEITISGITSSEAIVFVDASGRVTSLPLLSSSETSSTFSVTSLPASTYTCMQGAKRGRFLVIR